MVSVLDGKTVWPHPTSASALFLLFQAASNHLTAPLTLHKDPLFQPSSLLSPRLYFFCCLVAPVIISGGWFVSGVLRILTAAARKEGNSKSCKGDILKNAAKGRKKGNVWVFSLNKWRWKNNRPLSSRRNYSFSFHLLLERVFVGMESPSVFFGGWEGKWQRGDKHLSCSLNSTWTKGGKITACELLCCYDAQRHILTTFCNLTL